MFGFRYVQFRMFALVFQIKHVLDSLYSWLFFMGKTEQMLGLGSVSVQCLGFPLKTKHMFGLRYACTPVCFVANGFRNVWFRVFGCNL